MANYDDEKRGRGHLTERERETLPVWAQERLTHERRTAENAVKSYEAQFDAQEPTTIAYGDVYNNPRYLPDGLFDRINVSMDGTDDVTRGHWVSLVRKQDERTGAPYVEVSSSGGIAVVSQASNVVRLYLVERGQLVVPKDEPKA